MTLFVAALLGWAMWSAAPRTVRLDDVAARAAATLPDRRVNLNTAGAAELSILPGLGPGLAQRIVENRERHGRFDKVDELRRVPGIGPAIVERIRPHAAAE